jgi:hypothetical protein
LKKVRVNAGKGCSRGVVAVGTEKCGSGKERQTGEERHLGIGAQGGKEQAKEIRFESVLGE